MIKMDGHLTKYLYYENTGKSQLTIPRKFLEIEKFNWNHNDDVYLVAKEIDGQKGIFIFKKKSKYFKSEIMLFSTII